MQKSKYFFSMPLNQILKIPQALKCFQNFWLMILGIKKERAREFFQDLGNLIPVLLAWKLGNWSGNLGRFSLLAEQNEKKIIFTTSPFLQRRRQPTSTIILPCLLLEFARQLCVYPALWSHYECSLVQVLVMPLVNHVRSTRCLRAHQSLHASDIIRCVQVMYIGKSL